MIVIALVAVLAPKLDPRRVATISNCELAAIAVSLIAATGWCQELILPTTVSNNSVLFKPWSDFFTHASILARLQSDQTIFQFGSYEWKGFPAIPYHYASYSLAALVAKVGNIRAYTTAVGFWVPFGSFLCGLGSFALGRAFWNERAGLISLIAVFLIRTRRS